MADAQTPVERRVLLSPLRAERLSRLAQQQRTSEDAVIERALDILFSLTDLLDEQAEHRGWSFVSGDSLQRLWGNDEDAAYDDWRKLYGVPAR